MELIPSIDLLGGKVVRLAQGDYARVTVYADDPVREAQRFAEAGARMVHVVDLDGARTGEPAHAAMVRRIVAEAGVAVQVGGGVRDRAAAERWLAGGASRVVMGTAVVREPEVVAALCAAWPGRVVAALDARDGEVAIDGWTKGSGRRVEDLAREVDAWGAAAILFTDVSRDGMRAGPAVDATAALQRGVGATVIASGGVGAVADLLALARAGVRAAVAGRAIYEGALDVRDAIAQLAAREATA